MPGAFVNTTSVHKTQLKALAAHKSQQNWLDVSQGMNSYLLAMEDMSLAVGRMSKKFKYAEGWRRHLHSASAARTPTRWRGAGKELPGQQSLRAESGTRLLNTQPA